jgi:cell division septal protein FtsQ
LAALALVVFLLTNHRFIVRRVDFDGNRTIPAGRLSLLVPVPSHQNVFLYVLAHHKRIAQTIKQAEPPIDQVHVRPGLPNRLVVHVTERSPFVQLRENHGGLWLVDRNGVPYREISSRKVNLVAVIVPFGSVDPIILGKPLPLGNGSMLGTAFTALAAARKVSALGPDEIKDIRVDQSLNLCLNTSNNLLIKLGQPDNLGIKIADAAAIMTDDAQQADSAVYIDVSEPKHPAFMPRPGSTLVGASSN